MKEGGRAREEGVVNPGVRRGEGGGGVFERTTRAHAFKILHYKRTKRVLRLFKEHVILKNILFGAKKNLLT